MNNQASVVGQDGKPCAVPSHETLRQPNDYHNDYHNDDDDDADDDNSSVAATPDENHHSATASRQPQQQQGQAKLQTFLALHVPTDVLRQVGTLFLHHAMTQQQQQPWRYIAFIRRHFDQWVEFAAAIILAAEQAQQLEVNQAAHIIQQALFRLDESSSSGDEEGSTANPSSSSSLFSSPSNMSKTTKQQQQQKTTLSLHDDENNNDTSQLAQALQLCILQGFADEFLRKHCLAFVTAIEGQAQGTALVLSWLGGKDTHGTNTNPSKSNGGEASSTKSTATSDTAVKTIPTTLRKEMAQRTRMPPPPPPPQQQQQQDDEEEEEDTSTSDVRKAHKRPRSNTPSQRILTEGTSSSSSSSSSSNGNKLFPALLQSTTVPTKLDLSCIASTTLSMQDWQRWGQMLACKEHFHGLGEVQELSLPVLPPTHLQAFANCFSNGHFRTVALVHDNSENNNSSILFPIFGGNQVQMAFESLGGIVSKSLALLLYQTAYSMVDVLPGLAKGFASLLPKQPSLRLVIPLSTMSDPPYDVGQAILQTNIVSDLWVEARNVALDETFYRALTLIARTPSLRTLYICDAICHPIVFRGNIWQSLQSAFVASRLQTLVLGNLQGGTQQQQHAGTDFLTSLFAAMASQQQQQQDEEEEPSLNGAGCRYLSHLWLSFHPNCRSWGVVVHQSLAFRLAACRHLQRLTCDFYPETLDALRQAATAAGSIQLVEATPAAVVVQKGGDSNCYHQHKDDSSMLHDNRQVTTTTTTTTPHN